MQDGADVLATAHVFAAARAVDAVRCRHLCLAARALEPLLSRLVAPDGRFRELLPELPEMVDEAARRIQDRQLLAVLTQLDGREAFEHAVPLLDQLHLFVAQDDAPRFLDRVFGVLDLLPVADLESEPAVRAAEPPVDQVGLDEPYAVERLVGPLDRVLELDLVELLDRTAE